MRVEVAPILIGMGYTPDGDFIAVQNGAADVAVVWLAPSPMPTEAAIDAAAPAIITAIAADAQDAISWQTDKAALKTTYAAAVARMIQIRDAGSLNNAQVLQAVRDLAGYQVQIVKVLRRLL